MIARGSRGAWRNAADAISANAVEEFDDPLGPYSGNGVVTRSSADCRTGK
jgi:hypothetical protein